MIQGFATLGAVALRLVEDNYHFGMRANSKYSLEQSIEVVCFQKRTVAGNSVSYIWWWFTLDEGEISVHYDIGNLKPVRLQGERRRYRHVPAGSGEVEISDLIAEWTGEETYSSSLSAVETAMIRLGVQPDQRCLSRYTETWSVDYYGESDCDIGCDLLYVEPLGNCSHAYLPVPLGGLGIARPKMKGLTVG